MTVSRFANPNPCDRSDIPPPKPEPKTDDTGRTDRLKQVDPTRRRALRLDSWNCCKRPTSAPADVEIHLAIRSGPACASAPAGAGAAPAGPTRRGGEDLRADSQICALAFRRFAPARRAQAADRKSRRSLSAPWRGARGRATIGRRADESRAGASCHEPQCRSAHAVRPGARARSHSRRGPQQSRPAAPDRASRRGSACLLRRGVAAGAAAPRPAQSRQRACRARAPGGGDRGIRSRARDVSEPSGRTVQPRQCAAWNGRYDEAIAAFDRTLASVPRHAEAWNNRAIALYALNRHAQARASCGRAIAARKDYSDAHHNEALSLLAMGDFARGLPKYEWRLRTGNSRPRALGRPLWLGEYPLPRKTVLLHAEQGLGDTIQFVRYAPLLARAGAKVILEVQAELADLLRAIDGVDRIVTRGEKLPAFDVHCPIPSLPLAFRTGIDSIPAEIPYLRARGERLAKWEPRVAALARPVVALAWAGNSAHVNDRNRSIALSRLDPLVATAGVRFA